jgi:thioester reductase-like protein
VVNPNDFQSLIIKACVRAGCAPQVPDWKFEMTPVDFLAKVITKISDGPAHLGKVYNVVQQDPVTADEVFAYMESNGLVTDRVPLGEWKTRLQATADRENDLELKVLIQSLDSVEPYLSDVSVYDNSRFNEALPLIGLPAPTVDLDYVTKFLRVT